jgi:hypothetical protein
VFNLYDYQLIFAHGLTRLSNHAIIPKKNIH